MSMIQFSPLKCSVAGFGRSNVWQHVNMYEQLYLLLECECTWTVSWTCGVVQVSIKTFLYSYIEPSAARNTLCRITEFALRNFSFICCLSTQFAELLSSPFGTSVSSALSILSLQNYWVRPSELQFYLLSQYSVCRITEFAFRNFSFICCLNSHFVALREISKVTGQCYLGR